MESGAFHHLIASAIPGMELCATIHIMRTQTLRNTAALACVLAAVGILINAGLPPRSGVLFRADQTRVAPEPGALAPPLSAFDLAGRWIALDTLRGRPIILNFWASWCAPCLREMPLLESAVRQHPELTVIGINANEPMADALSAVNRLAVTYPIIPDHDGRWLYVYQVRTLPVTLFVDRDGIVRHRFESEVTSDMVTAALSDIR